MLKVSDLQAGYGDISVIQNVSFEHAGGEVLGVLGRNGAGKTTLLKAIMRLVQLSGGEIEFDGQRLDRLHPHQIARCGLSYVPQGRRLFPQMSVRENLRMGLLAGGAAAQSINEVLELFPEIANRLSDLAGTLSGGQQQMVAMARALCVQPRLLLLDEPSEGLMPRLVARVLETIETLKQRGVAVVLVEQRVESVLAYADRVLLIENGQVQGLHSPAELVANPMLIQKVVGVKTTD